MRFVSFESEYWSDLTWPYRECSPSDWDPYEQLLLVRYEPQCAYWHGQWGGSHFFYTREEHNLQNNEHTFKKWSDTVKPNRWPGFLVGGWAEGIPAEHRKVSLHDRKLSSRSRALRLLIDQRRHYEHSTAFTRAEALPDYSGLLLPFKSVNSGKTQKY